ncbi:MAG: amidase family protein [bacterium]
MNPVFATATQLAAAIRERHVTASDVLEAHLAQIDAHNPAINAIVTMDAHGARQRAREADAALARGEPWGPLHGVPFTLKDAHATAHMRTTTGFPPFDHVPESDGAVASRLKAAGGIIIGKSNVPVMLSDFQTSNPIFGTTNNPWDVKRTPGGSSGGAAAAVASGMVPFDIGTDLAGSVRIPAHFSGVYALKPTEHRVSLDGVVPDPHHSPRSVRIMSCIGPVARSVDDIDLLYRIIAGPDGRDTDVPPVPLGVRAAIDLAGLRIAYAPTFPGFPVAAEIRDAIETLAQALQSIGASVVEAPLPSLDFRDDLRRGGALVGMITSAFQPDTGNAPATIAQYFEALARRDQSIMAWEQFFGEWDVLLCPPSMTTAFPHCTPGSPLSVDGRDESYWMVSAHAALFNYPGNPAIVMPCTLDRDGLPLGIQLVGRRWDESRLLGIAKAMTAFTGEFRRPSGF